MLSEHLLCWGIAMVLAYGAGSGVDAVLGTAYFGMICSGAIIVGPFALLGLGAGLSCLTDRRLRIAKAKAVATGRLEDRLMADDYLVTREAGRVFVVRGAGTSTFRLGDWSAIPEPAFGDVAGRHTGMEWTAVLRELASVRDMNASRPAVKRPWWQWRV